MKHKNFYRFSAQSNYDLGLQMGETFKKEAESLLERLTESKNWSERVHLSQKSLKISEEKFPYLIEELKGYSYGAGIDFQDLWAGSLEDELDNLPNNEKCTSVIANNGLLISHNEDWDKDAEDYICIVEKTVGDLTLFELYYYNTLGGNSISINSFGFVQCINSLTSTDQQIGIPRNVIARWISETKDPISDFENLKNVQRSTGYNHILVNKEGLIYNIECSAKQQDLTKPHSPFVHTNHYIGTLKPVEAEVNDGINSTFNRYNRALQLARPTMTKDELITLTNNDNDGDKMSIFNERTIGKMVIDLKNKNAKVWLKRESDIGWIDYPLVFI